MTPAAARPRADRRVLVDTSAFYALADSNDTNHQAACSIANRLAERQYRQFTTNLVLAELHALVLVRLGRAVAFRVLQGLDRSNINVVRVTAADEARARTILSRYDDKDFSLADTISFAVMERYGILHCFAFDRHFAQYGFAPLTPTEVP